MPNLIVNGVCHSVDAALETLYGSTGELRQGLRPARTRFNTGLRCWAARASWIRWCSVPGMATAAPRSSSIH
jgi:hypothetical protein